MWVLLEHCSESFEWGVEFNHEEFYRLDFRGVFETQHAAFEAAMEFECSNFSVVVSEINEIFISIEHTTPAQYKTNGEYVIELATDHVVFGNDSAYKEIPKLEELLTKLKEKYKATPWCINSICHQLIREATGKDGIHGIYSLTPPFIYSLKFAQITALIEKLNNELA